MNKPKPGRSMFRAAFVVSFFTLVSRVFGFVRDMVIANYFGAGSIADSFFIAFRIPNLLRRLTAEGALSAAFIPVFAKTLQKNRVEAFRLANNLLAVMTLILVLIVTLGIVFTPELLKVIAIGFTDEEEKFRLTVQMTRLLFPYLVFISLAAVLMGILNTLDHFASPAASPVMLNASIIICAIYLRESFDLPVFALVAGVLIGGVLQLAIQIPYAIKHGFIFSPVFDLRSELLRKVFMLTIPALFGVAVAEINMFIDTVLASLLKEGSVSYLYYGNRLVQFPLGVFGIAMSTALLPALSFQAADNNPAKMTETISRSFRAIMMLVVPSTVGLVVLRDPIVNILFERGEFDSVSTLNTGIAVGYYSAGLLGFVGVKIFVSAFYALGDTKTPVKVASVAMVVNIVFNLLLMGPLQHGGLALATSIASFVNLVTLIFLLRGRLGEIDGARMFRSFVLLTLASLLMAAVLYGGWEIFFQRGYTVLGLILSITTAVAVYFAAVWMMRMEELTDIVNSIRTKLRKIESKS